MLECLNWKRETKPTPLLGGPTLHGALTSDDRVVTLEHLSKLLGGLLFPTHLLLPKSWVVHELVAVSSSPSLPCSSSEEPDTNGS